MGSAPGSLKLVGGWTVSTAADGAQAVELATRLQPDAIMMDVMMPGTDGPTAVRHLQSNPATTDIPVILLTAKAQNQDRHQWQHLPLAGVITKPFDPLTLTDTASRLLGWETG